MLRGMALALPKLRWLVIGAVAAGVWVLREDMRAPHPPQAVSLSKPDKVQRPAKPVAARPVETKPSQKAVAERPVPPRSVPGKPPAQLAIAPKREGQKTALALPATIEKPPAKPKTLVTGSIQRPDKPTFVQTTAKVHLRAQAHASAAIIATLEPRTVMRELARSGDWRLVMGDGRKGWVRTDYLAAPTFLSRRPKLPVADVRQAKAN